MKRMALGAIAGVAFLAAPAEAEISGRFGMHGAHLAPQGAVDEFADDAWGGGMTMMVNLPGTRDLLGADLGLEGANFSTTTLTYQPTPFDFRRELRTSRDLWRLYLGLQLGPHGHGFFQPYAAVHGALVNHSIQTTLTEPDDLNPDLTHSQTSNEGDWGTGWDASLGANLNFWNRLGAEGGVRYIQSFGLDEPLGDEKKTIDPEYFQVFVGMTITFDYLAKLSEEEEDEKEDEEE